MHRDSESVGGPRSALRGKGKAKPQERARPSANGFELLAQEGVSEPIPKPVPKPLSIPKPALKPSSTSASLARLPSLETLIKEPSNKPGRLLSELPIATRLEEILQTIQVCRTKRIPQCTIVAPTGTGKSLGVPNVLAKAGLRVCISVPTITAAISLWQRQKQILADEGVTDIQVGYSVEGEKHYSKECKIVYATSGHWRRKLLGLHNASVGGKMTWRDLTFCDVFILDEAHTRTVDNDIILDLITHARKTGRRVPLLCQASATLGAQYENRIGAPVKPDQRCPMITIDVKSYPIRIEYFGRDFEIDDSEIYVAIVERVKRSPEEEGDILIFVHGSDPIEKLISWLEPLKGFAVVPAYSALTKEEISKIYAPVPKGIRKIVIATNIAESSITIPGIGCVLDTLMEKRAISNASGGKALQTMLISQQSADQRKGRTGRDRPGTCVRFCRDVTFDELEPARPAEITRVPLEFTILEVLSAGFDPSELFGVHEPRVPIEKIETSMALLRELELIDPNNSVTPKGTFAATLPLSVRNSALLYRWILDKKPIHPAVVYLALIECYGPSYVWVPRSVRNEGIVDEHMASYFEKYRSWNELAAFARIWNDMIEEVGLTAPGWKIENYCRESSLHGKKILEVRALIRQITSALGEFSIMTGPGQSTAPAVEMARFEEETMLRELIPYFSTIYANKIYRRMPMGRGRYINPTCMATASLNTRAVICSVDQLNQVIALASMTITGKKGSFDLISLYLPVEARPNESFFSGYD